MKPINTRVGRVVRGATAALDASRQRLDDLNVYPVPDGDTGTNMTQTIRKVRDDLAELPGPASAGDLVDGITRSALIGARGNSGVILSQIIRGFASNLPTDRDLDGRGLAAALRGASDAAYGAVTNPVEGTILTVVREMAEEAEDAAKSPLDGALTRVLARGADALERTPTMLQKLADAGVVDAGGAGLLEVARGAVAGWNGEHVEATEAAGSSDHIVVHDVDADSPYRYCTGFLLLQDRDDLDAAAVRRLMEPLGDSLLVVGDESALRVHVHTDDPGSALSCVVGLGSLNGVEISDMQAQVKDRTERLTHRPEAGTPKRRCDVVAVVQGAGATRLAEQLGARAVVDGGQTQNPSTEQLLEAIESCNSDEVVVLPNNDNILLAARSAAGLASRPVVVVETSSIPAGLIALGSYTAGLSAEENGATMRASVNRMADGAITRASRDARVDGVPVDKGAWIGLVDGRLVATSQRVSEVASRVAAAMLGPNRQRLMLLRGGEHVVPDDLDDAVARVAEAYPHVTIDQHDGGQDHYPLLLAAYTAEERLEASTTAIVFDSTADISTDRVTNPSWTMVPLTLRFGDEEFVDGVTLTGAQFYDRLKHTDEIARTAAPSPGAFEVAYRDLLERYRTIVSLHISGKLSATVESARTGSADLGDRVRVYDTYVTSALLGLVVEAVQRMLDEGTSAAELDEFVRRIPSRSGISFSLDTLEYLQRNGRIGRGKALIGGLLRVRPILSLVNGEVDAVRRVRGKRAAIPALVDDMLKRSAGFDRIDVAILHADSERDAERLARTVRESRTGITSMQTVGIGAVIGAHVGPGALGIAFLAR